MLLVLGRKERLFWLENFGWRKGSIRESMGSEGADRDLTAEEVDKLGATEIQTEFILPLIYDIIKTLEKESSESVQGKRSEFQESSAKVLELQRKLDGLRDQIKKLPGIEYSKEDQLRRLEGYRKQVILKKKLLQKYKDMCALEGIKQYLTPGS